MQEQATYADLEAAIQAAQQAVDSTPEDHPGRAAYLDNLESSLRAGSSERATWPI